MIASRPDENMTDITANVRQAYDRWAGVYDHDGNPLLAMEAPAMRSIIGHPAGLAALDLGCGTGRHALWLASAGANVTAVDFSPAMLQQARRKPGAHAVRFLAHDLHEPLPFADESFDLVVSGLVLEHLRDLGPFFAEAYRLLKPAGRAAISAMHPDMFLRGAQARFTDPDSGVVIQPGSVPHSVGAIALSAARAGFELLDILESAPDARLAAEYPRAEKYLGWPMLLALSLAKH